GEYARSTQEVRKLPSTVKKLTNTAWQAVAYVRPHDIEVTREQADAGATRAIIRHLHTAGPVVRLELERQDGGGVVEAELSRERYRELHLEVGEHVFIRPRDLRVFLEDYTI
ncbi:MAG: sulfate ABC transporter ATP-binding protein, partial [Deltaproteobacteria bacterium CG_4_9_14_3_um_filter_65_9]